MLQESPQVPPENLHNLGTEQEYIPAEILPIAGMEDDRVQTSGQIGYEDPFLRNKADFNDPQRSIALAKELGGIVHGKETDVHNATVREESKKAKEEAQPYLAEINADMERQRQEALEDQELLKKNGVIGEQALTAEFGTRENWPTDKREASDDAKQRSSAGLILLAGVGALAGMTAPDEAIARDNRRGDYFERQLKAVGANIGVQVLERAIGDATGYHVDSRKGPLPIPGARRGQNYGGEIVYRQAPPTIVYRQGGGYQQQGVYENDPARMKDEADRNIVLAKIQNLDEELQDKAHELEQARQIALQNPRHRPASDSFNYLNRNYENRLAERQKLVGKYDRLNQRLGNMPRY